MKTPTQIIGENLPTFAGLYKGYTEAELPTHRELTEAAEKIIAALKDNGYSIRKDTPPSTLAGHRRGF